MPCSEDGQPSVGDREHYELRQSQRQLQQISDAAQAFSLQLDFYKLLADIAQHGYEILRSDQVIVHSNIDNQLRARVQYPTTRVTDDVVRDDVTWCIRYLKPKVSNQPLQDGSDIRNSVCVPIVATQNRVLGVIEFRNKRFGGIFTAQDARVASCLARVATSAVDRALLFFRIEEWKQSMETLLSFNATVNQHLEPEKMIRELVANVTGFLDADGGASGLALRNESQVVLQCEGFYFSGKWHEFNRRWQSGDGVPGVVLETEFPYLINDYGTNPLSDPALSDQFDLGSCICVPIKNAREQVLGFFQLHRRSGRPEFTWQDAAFLESLGNTAAVAIENARLVKSLELKNAQIKTLSLDHVQRLEEERQHIARELHDETGQVLIGLKLRLKILSGLLTDDQKDAKDELAELRGQLSKATVKLKDLAKRLRPPTLDELGFESALRQLVSEFRRQAGLIIQLDVHNPPELPNDSETALYRIVQECLTNVAKHADATQVDISMLKEGEHCVLRIADNGIGFDSETPANGLGLVGIRERVRMLGGSFDIRSYRGNGTTIEVTLAGGDPE